MHPAPQLAADYYLDNFKKLTEHALTWYADILTPNELSWIERFSVLPKQSQCLLVRLYSRRGSWFRSDKLEYTEIPQLKDALTQLQQQNFIELNGLISEQDLAASLLTKPEVLECFPQLDRKAPKHQLVASLTDTPFTRFESLNFDCIELLNSELISVLLTLFFANTHQDLSQFVLDDLGLHQFEQYPLSKERRFFTSRDEIDQLLTLSQLSKAYWLCNQKDKANIDALLEALSQVLPAVSEHSYIARKQFKLINDLARDLERFNDFPLAIEWFEKSPLPPSRERQARIYDKLNDNDGFSRIVHNMLASPENESELEVAIKLEQRLLRKQGQKVPRAKKPKTKEHHLLLDLTQQRVELAAMEHFIKAGYQAFYGENVLLNGLFGLAFWDVVFADVEGAFINAYQHRPLDLYHSDFSQKRKVMFEKAFKRLTQNGFEHMMQTYRDKFGLANPFVHWNGLSQELLDQACKHIPIDTLLALFKIMMSDLKLYRNGMPDLIVFKDGGFEWIEVKGPGDKLQDNQWRWIKQFKRLGIPFSVCWVNQ
ncbi:VRR-NUC domain-containing protein [Vibrio paucivorans]|uniref:phosphodiesterase I n=1 Tax=Vibrio paucivorans TaxID=2829489 RepID=A0A9X3CBE2_9VIBR|nr:VRR-NUC domain-containing protein [Vibrio paucivorans]MCW8332571.1 VRR-NUC domain-containing protein [Vibrio paucivorans]